MSRMQPSYKPDPLRDAQSDASGAGQAGVDCKPIAANNAPRNTLGYDCFEDMSKKVTVPEATVAAVRDRRLVRKGSG